MKQTIKTANLNEYKVWILDFDGTLYYQFPVRVLMGIWLLAYYFLHFWRIRELFIIFDHRKMQECLSGTAFTGEYLSDFLIKKLSDKYHIDVDEVSSILKSWLEIKPCHFIHYWQRKKLIKTIKKYQKNGVLMVVYSDNPLQEKIKAVSFVPDYCFDSDHKLINCIKPNIQGINNIIELLGKKKEKFIFIGDRYDRDGICAENAGIKYFDVHEFVEIL